MTESKATASSELEAEVLKWRATRLKNLTSENGWLTLCGLFWLEEGNNTLGSDASCNVVLPESCPKDAGVLVREGQKITLRARAGAGITLQGDAKAVESEIELQTDASKTGPATVVSLANGDVTFFIVVRDTKIGVRMKNKKAKTFTEFKGLRYFPVNPKWSVVASYHPHKDGAKTLPLINAYGLRDPQKSSGYLEFSVDGKTHTLDAVDEEGDDRFWLLFKDQTNGKETYGMRYLYCAKPNFARGENTCRVDFNQSYSPPCAFTSFATCALPPKQNHLQARVEAGELNYEGGDH